MALERRSIIDQIEIRRDGTVQVRIARQVVDGEEVIASNYHRMAFAPGADVAAGLAVVNDHLTKMGETVLNAAEAERITRVVAIEHTAEVIAAFAARRAAAEAKEAELLGLAPAAPSPVAEGEKAT